MYYNEVPFVPFPLKPMIHFQLSASPNSCEQSVAEPYVQSLQLEHAVPLPYKMWYLETDALAQLTWS